jgi:hypothetical protein
MTDKNNEPGLTSKKKLVVSKHAYFHAPRSVTNYQNDVSNLRTDIIEEANNGKYFAKQTSDDLDFDAVRVVLGKNWDYRVRDPTQDEEKIFSNNWSSPKVFYNSPINLEYCGDTEIVDDGDDQDTLNDQAEAERIVLSCKVFGDQTAFVPGKIQDWLYYMKTGVQLEGGASYEPIVKTQYNFYDHFHRSINPFTPKELETMQPVGKAFYADFKTYYNERSRASQGQTSNFEKVTGENPNIQNSLPSIYSFLRLLSNPELVENDSLKLWPIIGEMILYILGDGGSEKNKLKTVYTDLLQKYPLETLILQYGTVGHQLFGPFANSQIVERILSLNFDKVDADSLFSDYFLEYTSHIVNQERLKFNTDNQYNRVRALERIMYNLVFSPHSIKLLNKVDQYKKYFPFYSELEFTANLFTSLGDSMKQLFLTKFMSDVVLARNTTSPEKSDDVSSYNWPNYTNIDPASSSGVLKYVEYREDKSYTDISSQAVDTAAGSITETDKKDVNLDYVLQLWLKPENNDYIKDFVDEIEGIHLGPQQLASNNSFDYKDLRNYTTYFRNDFSEPININSDDNVIFKKLFGAAFQAKILDLYKQHKRSYSDIMNGVPAYAEDLFYRIEKIRIDPSTGEEKVVQNILIPNTSELNVVKYVDTQLKYFTYATYKYNVYSHTVVFGAKYKYLWLNSNTGAPYTSGTGGRPWNHKVDLSSEVPIEQILEQINEFGEGVSYETTESGTQQQANNSGKAVGEQELGGEALGGGAGGGPFGGDESPPIETQPDGFQNAGNNAVVETNFAATFRVHLTPSIKIIPNKIFSTPEIMIMDKPPVIPDVNIIPYRGVNNQVKILITGASDRYRVPPVIMLESDQEEYAKISAAQLSVDGKIEFGSDDPVRNFQIFRIQKKPSAYADFELYDQISQQYYEEQILPNTKYYYTFRAIDDHGHVSNPTPVYEVELIDEKGAVKPIIRLVEMDKPKNKSNIKECQKYIYVKPNLQQLYFSDNPEIDSIFSDQNKKKKYKMRITSKGSGKKIDINLSFRKKIQTD